MSFVSAPTTSPSAPRTLPKRWNSRPLRRRCSRLSQAPPAILSRCSRLCCRRPFAFVAPRLAISIAGTVKPETLSQRTTLLRRLPTNATIHVPDQSSEEAYIKKLDPVTVAAVELGRVRTALFVPMLKETELIGFFGVARQEVRPFTDKQIALV